MRFLLLLNWSRCCTGRMVWDYIHYPQTDKSLHRRLCCSIAAIGITEFNPLFGVSFVSLQVAQAMLKAWIFPSALPVVGASNEFVWGVGYDWLSYKIIWKIEKEPCRFIVIFDHDFSRKFNRWSMEWERIIYAGYQREPSLKTISSLVIADLVIAASSWKPFL